MGVRLHFRAHLPRFTGDNLASNLGLVDALRAVAADTDASVAQIAIAWVMAQGDDIIPLIGARERTQLDEALGAAAIALSADDLARIEAAVPGDAAAGERYGDDQMAMLDSERGAARG